jgi:hypothetical protein
VSFDVNIEQTSLKILYLFYSPPVIHLSKKVIVIDIFHEREREKEKTKLDNCVLVVIHNPGANIDERWEMRWREVRL